MKHCEKWSEMGARERWQIINGTALIFGSIILYFLSFILTLSIGMGEISACSSMMATALALFGITSYFKNQITEFETRIEREMNIKDEDDTRGEDDNREDRQEDDRQ